MCLCTDTCLSSTTDTNPCVLSCVKLRSTSKLIDGERTLRGSLVLTVTTALPAYMGRTKVASSTTYTMEKSEKG